MDPLQAPDDDPLWRAWQAVFEGCPVEHRERLVEMVRGFAEEMGYLPAVEGGGDEFPF